MMLEALIILSTYCVLMCWCMDIHSDNQIRSMIVQRRSRRAFRKTEAVFASGGSVMDPIWTKLLLAFFLMISIVYVSVASEDAKEFLMQVFAVVVLLICLIGMVIAIGFLLQLGANLV